MLERCVACNSDSWSPAATVHGYRLALCASCGATFTLNPDYDAGRYVAAYEGGEREGPVAGGNGYVYRAPAARLGLEIAAAFSPPPRLTPAQRIALQWLKRHTPPGAAVIDCGCGSGLFLRALSGAGLRGAGVEVSPVLVTMLRRRGLETVRGAAPDFPWEGSPPFAITFFEVLEHIPEPVDIIGAVVKRFPGTAIIASVPSPTRVGLFLRGERGPSDYPPNHFVRWTPRALDVFFHGLGFARVTVHLPPPAGSELLPGFGQMLKRRPARSRKTGLSGEHVAGDAGILSPAKRLGATGILWAHRAYQLAADIIGAPPAWRAHARGASAGSMLAVAEPAPVR
jgi:SAM-dependent methyltransferase